MTANAQDSPVKTVVFPKDGRTVHRIPSIVVSTDGTILAFADRRVGSRSDWGHRTDIVLRRSTDNGETWQPVQTLFGQDSVCAHGGPTLVDRQAGRVFKFFRKNPAESKTRQLRNWSATAVKRSVPMLLGLYSLVVVWFEVYVEEPQEHRIEWPWYEKRHVTVSDMLTAVRADILSELVFQRPCKRPDEEKLIPQNASLPIGFALMQRQAQNRAA